MAQRSESLAHVLVVVPTYNEAENIEPIINRLRAAVPNAYALIADDNSPDGTGDIAAGMARASSPTGWLHKMTRSTSYIEPAKKVWPRPISQVSSGDWTEASTFWSRWTRTAPINPNCSHRCSRR